MFPDCRWTRTLASLILIVLIGIAILGAALLSIGIHFAAQGLMIRPVTSAMLLAAVITLVITLAIRQKFSRYRS